jgi:hypothetical protein
MYYLDKHKTLQGSYVPARQRLDLSSSPLGYPTFHLWQAHYQWFYAAISESGTYIKKLAKAD